MVKMTALPEQAIIDGLKGKIDFYLFHASSNPEVRGKGIPVARRWPRSPGRRRALAVEAQWAAWAHASREWSNLAGVVQDAYRAQAAGTKLSGRDLFTRGYLSGLQIYEKGGEETMVAYPARAYKNDAAQTINHGTNTKVTFDTIDYDPNERFFLDTNRFVALEAGYYLCLAQTRFSSPVADKAYAIWVSKNGGVHNFKTVHTSIADKIMLTSAAIVQLAVDDFLEVWVWHSAGVADDIATGIFNTFIEVHRLS